MLSNFLMLSRLAFSLRDEKIEAVIVFWVPDGLSKHIIKFSAHIHKDGTVCVPLGHRCIAAVAIVIGTIFELVFWYHSYTGLS